jgi:hypothetical protein
MPKFSAENRPVLRQIFEALKVIAIGFGYSWAFSLIRYAQDGDGAVLGKSLFVLPLIVWMVFTQYPISIIWTLWLAGAHIVAVRSKSLGTKTVSKSGILRFALNRPLILLVVTILSIFLWGLGYQILSVFFLDLVYLTYLAISELGNRRANA